MHYRAFGHHGFEVSALGYGAGHIGSPAQDENDIARLLNTLADWGITLFDTAPGYDQSEQRLGKALKHRRTSCIYSTKLGYGVDGVPDWTAACITQGVDQALRRLHTDYLDIAHLHSCPLGTLEYGEVTEALQAQVKAGKVRVAAYSGENEALAHAIESGAFGSIQCSVNLTDQHSLNTLLPQATAQHMGVIAKRPLANAFWRFAQRPAGDYSEVYWTRWQQMALTLDMPLAEMALRFSAFAPGVHSAIVGSINLHHVHHNLQQLEKGPLPAEILTKLHQAFSQDWRGEV